MTRIYRRHLKVFGQAIAQQVRAIIGERNGRMRIDEVYDNTYSDAKVGEPRYVTIHIPLPTAEHYGDESDECEEWLWRKTRALNNTDFDEIFYSSYYRVVDEHDDAIGQIQLSQNRREERDRLDGREFHCGDGIRILRPKSFEPPVRSQWIGARYEMTGGEQPQPILHLSTWTEELVVPLNPKWIFRWP